MALDRAVRYAGNWFPGDADRPFGNAKNSTTETSKDGSPWEKDYLDDIDSFFQGLMSLNGISPSGIPDTVLVSDVLDGLNISSNKSGNLSRTLTSVVIDEKIDVDMFFKISDRNNGLFKVVTLASLGGAPLNGFDEIELTGQATFALKLQVDDWLNIKWLADLGNGEDSTLAEQHAAANYQYILVPFGTYLRTGKVNIVAKQIWAMANPEYTQNGVIFTTIFEAEDIADWAILGRTRCEGTLATGADVGAEKGLVIKGCSRYRVEAFTNQKMRSHGIHILAGASAPAPRGDQGQLSDCAAHQGRVGIEIDPDASAEFNVFSNFNASGNLDGAKVAAGNSLFMGGNIVDNERGVTLLAGANHAHGGFIGTQINHNDEYNMKAISILNGHKFSGCSFFGNGGATAPIIFENSKGISVDGGIIDCAIRNDGTTGQNAITNNYIPTTTPALFGTNKEFLRILGNWTDTGAWNINDGASEYSLVARGGSTQAVPAATTLVFNSAEKDKRTLYNLSTGDYTAPIAGTYAIKVVITVSGSGFTAAGPSFVEIQKNGTVIGHVTMTPVSDTVLLGSAATDLILAATDVVKLVSQIQGTSPVLAITSSRLTIELDQ